MFNLCDFSLFYDGDLGEKLLAQQRVCFPFEAAPSNPSLAGNPGWEGSRLRCMPPGSSHRNRDGFSGGLPNYIFNYNILLHFGPKTNERIEDDDVEAVPTSPISNDEDSVGSSKWILKIAVYSLSYLQ